VTDREDQPSSEELIQRAWEATKSAAAEELTVGEVEVELDSEPDQTESPPRSPTPVAAQRRPSTPRPLEPSEPTRDTPIRKRRGGGRILVGILIAFVVVRLAAAAIGAIGDAITSPEEEPSPEAVASSRPIGFVQDPSILHESFVSADGITFAGTARLSNGAASLTRKSDATQAGAMWSDERQPVADGFETMFVFEIDHVSWWSIGDGFAFVIQDSGATAVGRAGFGLGYADISNSLAIEFDTTYQDYLGDPRIALPASDSPGFLSNHVAVHTMGTEPNTSAARARLGYAGLDPVRLYDRQFHVGLIRYEPGELSIFVDDLDTPALVVETDLGSELSLSDGSAFVGFTAGTQGTMADHKIHSWAFESPCLLEGCSSG
jgi:hypothetical protein